MSLLHLCCPGCHCSFQWCRLQLIHAPSSPWDSGPGLLIRSLQEVHTTWTVRSSSLSGPHLGFPSVIPCPCHVTNPSFSVMFSYCHPLWQWGKCYIWSWRIHIWIHLYQLLHGWLWGSHFSPLGLSFLFCNMTFKGYSSSKFMILWSFSLRFFF